MINAIPTWNGAPGGSYGEIRCVRGDRCQQHFVPLPLSPNRMATVLQMAANYAHDRWDVYFGLNPRLRPRGGNDSVYCYTAMFVDVDAGKGRCPTELLSALPPSFVVSSGHGWHVYWFLRNPVLVRDGLEVARKLCAITNSDAVWAPAQTPRLPGTWNWKSQPPLPVVVAARGPTSYAFNEIGRVVHGLMPGALPDLPRAAKVEIPRQVVPAAELAPRLPRKLQRVYARYDSTYRYVDRSRADASLARWAVSEGWTDPEIAQLLSAPQRSKLIERLRLSGMAAAQHYLASTIGWARRSVERERLHAAA